MHHQARSSPDPWLALGLGSAALLGALALKANADAGRAERANPPRGRFVTAAGARLHCLDRGAGGAPPVVLLHGNAVDAEDWVASGVFRLLARRHRVVAFDRPGFGHSDRPRDRVWNAAAQAGAVAEALDRLGLARPILVAQSWGTLVAAALALDRPDLVGGLVLVSGYHYPTARADVALFSPPALPVLGDVLRYTVGPLVGRAIAPGMVRRMFAPLPVPARFDAAVPRSMMLRPSQLRAAAEDAATMIPDARAASARYAELSRIPVAILAGQEDGIVEPERHARRLHEDIPGSTLRIISGIGHMMHHAAPELVAEAVEEVGGTAAAPVGAAAVPA
ncbi:alpha/beta hydrolase [Falsiroseomonas bella]|uniref:Alpha/beta hydrolase n=1 Tax=Falsiroseomonas bella TaxID=2184016 RepID=A0A317FHR6_9PROT|nr:alpha/beta hydrolase [Falsiroseomonas bella]PWS38550.1 alpha/beta hydrolase [Falsiroseomonas bella]